VIPIPEDRRFGDSTCGQALTRAWQGRCGGSSDSRFHRQLVPLKPFVFWHFGKLVIPKRSSRGGADAAPSPARWEVIRFSWVGGGDLRVATLRAGRAEAAAVVWGWGTSVRSAMEASRRHRARVRGGLQALAGGIVGTALYAVASQRAAVLVWTVTGVVGVCALVSPLGLFVAIERSFAGLGRWTGGALSWLLLPIAFYGFFVPFRALFRRGHRDSMRRYFDAQSQSYWSLRKVTAAAQTPEERRRQYRP